MRFTWEAFQKYLISGLIYGGTSIVLAIVLAIVFALVLYGIGHCIAKCPGHCTDPRTAEPRRIRSRKPVHCETDFFKTARAAAIPPPSAGGSNSYLS